MKSIPFLDGCYPVRTVYTDNSDWQNHAGWQRVDVRNAALQGYLNMSLKRVLYASETHSGNVIAISDEGDDCLEAADEAGVLGSASGCDALATAAPGIMLCIWTADCIPLFLYDPEKNVAALAHCSWRSICSGIVSNTIDTMVERYDTNPGGVIAAFGPGICKECYEVGGELVEVFSKRFTAEEVVSLFTPKENGKYLLDLREAIKVELFHKSVEREKIHDVGICSYESEGYSSYRRNGPSELGTQTLSGIVLT